MSAIKLANSIYSNIQTQEDYLEELVKKFSGKPFTINDLQNEVTFSKTSPPETENIPKKTENIPKKTENIPKKTEPLPALEPEREKLQNPYHYDPSLCDARVWSDMGHQCDHKKASDECMCKLHLKADKKMKGGWWLGRITGPRPEIPVHPKTGNAVWKSELPEKPEETIVPKKITNVKLSPIKNKPAIKKKSSPKKKEASKKNLDEIAKLQALLEKAKKEAEEDVEEEEDDDDVQEEDVEAEEDVEVEDVEKAEADDFDDEGNKNITFEGVSYKVDSDGDVLNPEDYSVVGTWDEDMRELIFTDDEERDAHQGRKESS